MEENTKIIKTEKQIQNAFIKLIKSNGFDRMTISDIINEGHISRGTFYKHYADKFDLLKHYENDTLSSINEIFNRFPKPRIVGSLKKDEVTNNAFYQMFRYLYHHKKLMSALLSNNNNDLIFRIKKVISSEIDLSVELPALSNKRLEIPKDFAEEMILQNILSIIVYWITKEKPEKPEQAFQIFLESRSLSPADLTRYLGAL